MAGENSGRSGTNAAARAAAQRAAAQRAETERENRRLEAARAAAAAAARERAIAERRETERENRRISIPATPTYPGHYGQTPPSVGGGRGGGGNGRTGTNQENDVVVLPPMDTSPTPIAPIAPEPVKTPTRNVTDISSLVPQFNPEHIARVLFENVSAIELSKIERSDTIEGINQRFSIISNLSEIRKKYDATKQLTIMDKFSPLTSVFSIDIQTKIPEENYLELQGLDSTYQYLDENNILVTREKGHVYIDSNGDLVIELVNIESDQQVEIEIDTNGIIYKVES